MLSPDRIFWIVKFIFYEQLKNKTFLNFLFFLFRILASAPASSPLNCCKASSPLNYYKPIRPSPT